MIQECWRLHHQQGVIWKIYFAICCHKNRVENVKLFSANEILVRI